MLRAVPHNKFYIILRVINANILRLSDFFNKFRIYLNIFFHKKYMTETLLLKICR